MEGDNLNTCNRIRQLMKERNWTEYRLAKESGLSQSTIANIFKRDNSPTLPTLEAICKAFGITLAQFFSEGADPITLTEEQQELFKIWNTLTDDKKKALLNLIRII